VTTATAGNVAGHPDKDKEKVEKRRALGRGLASLLPGPRVLNPFAKKEETAANTEAQAPGSAVAPDATLKGPSSTAEDQVAAAASTKAESTDLAHATQNYQVSQTRGDVGHHIAALNSGAL
jgi:hypothetical protein